jgi:hypothetical protein
VLLIRIMAVAPASPSPEMLCPSVTTHGTEQRHVLIAERSSGAEQSRAGGCARYTYTLAPARRRLVSAARSSPDHGSRDEQYHRPSHSPASTVAVAASRCGWYCYCVERWDLGLAVPSTVSDLNFYAHEVYRTATA